MNKMSDEDYYTADMLRQRIKEPVNAPHEEASSVIEQGSHQLQSAGVIEPRLANQHSATMAPTWDPDHTPLPRNHTPPTSHTPPDMPVAPGHNAVHAMPTLGGQQRHHPYPAAQRQYRHLPSNSRPPTPHLTGWQQQQQQQQQQSQAPVGPQHQTAGPRSATVPPSSTQLHQPLTRLNANPPAPSVSLNSPIHLTTPSSPPPFTTSFDNVLDFAPSSGTCPGGSGGLHATPGALGAATHPQMYTTPAPTPAHQLSAGASAQATSTPVAPPPPQMPVQDINGATAQSTSSQYNQAAPARTPFYMPPDPHYACHQSYILLQYHLQQTSIALGEEQARSQAYKVDIQQRDLALYAAQKASQEREAQFTVSGNANTQSAAATNGYVRLLLDKDRQIQQLEADKKAVENKMKQQDESAEKKLKTATDRLGEQGDSILHLRMRLFQHEAREKKTANEHTELLVQLQTLKDAKSTSDAKLADMARMLASKRISAGQRQQKKKFVQQAKELREWRLKHRRLSSELARSKFKASLTGAVARNSAQSKITDLERAQRELETEINDLKAENVSTKLSVATGAAHILKRDQRIQDLERTLAAATSAGFVHSTHDHNLATGSSGPKGIQHGARVEADLGMDVSRIVASPSPPLPITPSDTHHPVSGTVAISTGLEVALEPLLNPLVGAEIHDHEVAIFQIGRHLDTVRLGTLQLIGWVDALLDSDSFAGRPLADKQAQRGMTKLRDTMGDITRSLDAIYQGNVSWKDNEKSAA